jgi:hypothetical protein
VWPPEFFETKLVFILNAARTPRNSGISAQPFSLQLLARLRRRNSNPADKRGIPVFWPLLRTMLTVQRFRQLVQQTIQVLVRLPLFLNLVDRMHHRGVVFAAKLPADLRQ